MPHSLFIVLEGPDGAGTTRHTQFLVKRLQREGYDAILTKEPTSGAHGQRLRRNLAGKEDMDPLLFQQIFCADRREHLDTVILPALRAGKIVVSDRYHLSTLVYGEAQGVERSLLEEMGKDFPEPDVTILTLPSFAVCRERLERRDTLDSFEQEEFHRRVYDLYVRYAEEMQIPIVDTVGKKEDVAEEVWSSVYRECIQNICIK